MKPSSRSRSCSITKVARLHPHITLVRTGQPLTIKNSDPVGHNTNISIYSVQSNDPGEWRNQD